MLDSNFLLYLYHTVLTPTSPPWCTVRTFIFDCKKGYESYCTLHDVNKIFFWVAVLTNNVAMFAVLRFIR